MKASRLSFNTRKALALHLGESAGTEVVALFEKLLQRIEELERNKVNVTRITPESATRTELDFQQP